MVRGGVKITTTLYYCSGRVTITSTINVTCLCQMALPGGGRCNARTTFTFCQTDSVKQKNFFKNLINVVNTILAEKLEI